MIFFYFIFGIYIIHFFNDFLLFIIQISLFIKLGAAPFHYWIPIIMSNLTWVENLILITWQKLIPIIVISYFLKVKEIIIILLITVIIGAVRGINQTSLNKLIAYSSINQIGWFLISIYLRNYIFKLYFIIYLIIILNIIFIFSWLNITTLIQLFSLNFNFILTKIFLFFNLLSLGGLPPFLGFYSKMILIKEIIWTVFPAVILIIVLISLVILFYYLKITYSCLLLNARSLWGVKDIERRHFFMIIFNFFRNVFLYFIFLFKF